jgi:hypothetical protein
MRGIDYTRLSGGTKIGDLEITTCPYCGRNGLVETINGKTFYTHEESEDVGLGGTSNIVFDMCPKSSLPSQ